MAAQDAAFRNGKPRVRADPHAELAITNHKYVKNCVELYLSQRGIDDIANFEDFVNVEVLWLNHNRIETLTHLDQCFRMKELYVQHNQIRSLQGSSLVHFKFLRTLRLNDNKLRDFGTTLAVLTKLQYLEDLDLYGNALQEEDNYRLYVIRAVPSLLVLDRHIVTDDERAKAARLRDEPLGMRAIDASQRNKNEKKREVVTGAPPQTVSGTVRLLLKAVEKNEREQEAASKVALAEELRRMDQQQQRLTHQIATSTSTRTSELTSKAGLDAWELAALKKRFREMEEKPSGGVAVDRLPMLVGYLADRGFAMTCDGTSLTQVDIAEHKQMSADAVTVLSTLFSQATVAWPQFLQHLESHQLQCHPLSTSQLKQRADAYFAQAAFLQKRLNALNSDNDDACTTLLREAHDAAQRAYHLTAVADGNGKVASIKEQKKTDKETLSPMRTQYYVTTCAREATETPAFHELKDQSARVSADLSTKYKLHHKEFQKYMVKQAPPATTVVRRQFHL